MIILIVLLLALVTAWVRGGRIENLLNLRLRFFALLFLPLAVQLVVFTPLRAVLGVGAEAIPRLYIFSMSIGAVVVALNLRLPGFPLLLAGLVSNLLVILLNGGYMPVSMPAREIAGLAVFGGVSNNVVEMRPDSPLWFLGDLFPIPRGIPAANVFSVGDVLIAAGGWILIQQSLISYPRERVPTQPL